VSSLYDDEPTLNWTKQGGDPTVQAGRFGDYQLLNEVARGGMGVVYKARQVKLNRVVALKMILAGQLASDEDVHRFYSEAEAAAGLDHPGIVPVFEVGEYEGQHFFSMGFVDGQPLSARIAKGPLLPREAAELLSKVAEAIQYAHDCGVIHRDLKPANVLLKPIAYCADQTAHGDHITRLDVQPMVTDFGLAKKVTGDSQLTGSGQVLGTPSYMPPEQASGEAEVRETADVYALGAVLYAALTGRPPFQAARPIDTLLQVLENDPVSPRKINPAVPRDLEAITLKCLAKEPRDRYRSARALRDDLQRYLHDEPVLARSTGSLTRLRLWTRRRPVAAGCTVSMMGLALLASGIALLVAGFMLWGRTGFHFFEDRSIPAVTSPATAGADAMTGWVQLHKIGLHELELMLPVQTPSWEYDRDELRAHYNFPVDFAVENSKGRVLGRGQTRMVWNAAIRQYQSSAELDEDTQVVSLTPVTRIGRFRTDSPQSIRIRFRIYPDDQYQAQAGAGELRLYEGIRDSRRAMLMGGMFLAAGSPLFLIGIVFGIYGPVLVTTRARPRKRVA
jgi:tRNA A-37 threonylcarbamoyl transferase component Bud32